MKGLYLIEWKYPWINPRNHGKTNITCTCIDQLPRGVVCNEVTRQIIGEVPVVRFYTTIDSESDLPPITKFTMNLYDVRFNKAATVFTITAKYNANGSRVAVKTESYRYFPQRRLFGDDGRVLAYPVLMNNVVDEIDDNTYEVTIVDDCDCAGLNELSAPHATGIALIEAYRAKHDSSTKVVLKHLRPWTATGDVDNFCKSVMDQMLFDISSTKAPRHKRFEKELFAGLIDPNTTKQCACKHDESTKHKLVIPWKVTTGPLDTGVIESVLPIHLTTKDHINVNVVEFHTDTLSASVYVLADTEERATRFAIALIYTPEMVERYKRYTGQDTVSWRVSVQYDPSVGTVVDKVACMAPVLHEYVESTDCASGLIELGTCIKDADTQEDAIAKAMLIIQNYIDQHYGTQWYVLAKYNAITQKLETVKCSVDPYPDAPIDVFTIRFTVSATTLGNATEKAATRVKPYLFDNMALARFNFMVSKNGIAVVADGGPYYVSGPRAAGLYSRTETGQCGWCYAPNIAAARAILTEMINMSRFGLFIHNILKSNTTVFEVVYHPDTTTYTASIVKDQLSAKVENMLCIDEHINVDGGIGWYCHANSHSAAVAFCEKYVMEKGLLE